MKMMVDCETDGRRWYSKEAPERAVMECFLGWALYEIEGNEGVRVGVGNKTAAFKWLNGDPKDEVEYLTRKTKG